MNNLIKTFVILILVIGVYSCSDSSNEPSNQQGTVEEFSEMIKNANLNFSKVNEAEPETTNAPDNPIFTYVNHALSSIKEKVQNDILSDRITINLKAGQKITFSFQTQNIIALDDYIFEVIYKIEKENGYYKINEPFTVIGSTISFEVNTSTDAKPGKYNFKFAIKDATTGLVSNYVYFEVIIEKDSNQDTYETITIGSQIWMQKNLDVEHYSNGDIIPQVTDPSQWANLTTGAWCYYDNDPMKGAIYGKLYNWYAVNDPRGLAPEGWSIPSAEDWVILIKYLGGELVAGKKLKESGTSHWSITNTGTNESGFTALPGGQRSDYPDGFNSLNMIANFWSKTKSKNSPYPADALSLMGMVDIAILGFDTVNGLIINNLYYGKSVRCIKN